MDFSNLKEEDAKQLLMQYDAQQRQLFFQLQQVQSAIGQLHAVLNGDQAVELNGAPQVQPVNSAFIPVGYMYNGERVMTQAPTEQPRKRPYTRNSPWPKFILDKLEGGQKTLSSREIYELGIKANVEDEMGFPDAGEVRRLISRALHRLSNQEKKISKFPLREGQGKGYNYALPAWLDKKGNLPDKYKSEDF